MVLPIDRRHLELRRIGDLRGLRARTLQSDGPANRQAKMTSDGCTTLAMDIAEPYRLLLTVGRGVALHAGFALRSLEALRA